MNMIKHKTDTFNSLNPKNVQKNFSKKGIWTTIKIKR